MKTKLIGIFVCTLFILSMIPTVCGNSIDNENEVSKSDKLIMIEIGYILGLIESYSEEFFMDEWVYNITAKFVMARTIAIVISPSFGFGTGRLVFINEDFKIRKEPFRGTITDNIISGVLFELTIIDINSQKSNLFI
jgi:hypothetical protein